MGKLNIVYTPWSLREKRLFLVIGMIIGLLF